MPFLSFCIHVMAKVPSIDDNLRMASRCRRTRSRPSPHPAVSPGPLSPQFALPSPLSASDSFGASSLDILAPHVLPPSIRLPSPPPATLRAPHYSSPSLLSNQQPVNETMDSTQSAPHGGDVCMFDHHSPTTRAPALPDLLRL